jgi:DNA-binding GntR family transcriptional regulator
MFDRTPEGLVLREGKRGFRVAPVSRADLVDLATTLC